MKQTVIVRYASILERRGREALELSGALRGTRLLEVCGPKAERAERAYRGFASRVAARANVGSSFVRQVISGAKTSARVSKVIESEILRVEGSLDNGYGLRYAKRRIARLRRERAA